LFVPGAGSTKSSQTKRLRDIKKMVSNFPNPKIDARHLG
jgi:hypothetical protein